jgi:Pleckstrin homology domain
MSGLLYRKPRLHASFSRCQVILTSGRLLIFHDSLRKYTGVELHHAHKSICTTLDLRGCYIYSGLLTESDLLYANQTFDSNRPGHHALPRIYPSQDGWTSQDEDNVICFVIWHPLHRNFFRAPKVGEDGQTSNAMFRRVSALGAPGRTVVFKTRSRTERDQWVLSIASEIDRLQEEMPVDIRIVSS